MGMGLLLIAAALFLTGYNVWDERRAGSASEEVLEQLLTETDEALPEEENAGEGGNEAGEVEIPDYVLNPEMEMAEKEIEGNSYIGTLEVPAIGLSLPVMSEWSYAKLKVAPCRYSGSVYLDNMVIAGHSYKRHFGALRSLPVGAIITFTDMDGNQFCYEVGAVEVLRPTEVGEMTESGWDLTLFTCSFDRRSRIALRCGRIKDGFGG